MPNRDADHVSDDVDVHSPSDAAAPPSDAAAPPAGELVNATTRMLLDRRNVLRAAGIVAVAGGGAAALAACSPAQPTSAPSSAAPSSAAPSSAAPSSAAPSSAAPSTAAPSKSATTKAPVPKGPSVNVAAVPQGSGVIMDEPNDYVVTQPAKGQYKAFTAICTHQQCRVTEMRGDRIYCGCHESEFSIKDGSVVQDPATEPLKEFDVTVTGGKVYVQA